MPGNITIAAGGSHTKLTGSAVSPRIQLEDSPPVNSCRPSVDVLFDSAATIFGGRIIATVLTGMGNDGAKGSANIKSKGGAVIVQDEETSVVWGMPAAVIKLGSADEMLPLDKIVGRWVEIIDGAAK